MNKKRIFSMALVCLLVFGSVFIFCSCEKAKFVGVWEGDDGEIEFFNNGKGQWKYGNMAWTAKNNRLTISIYTAISEFDYEFSKSTLILRFPSGEIYSELHKKK